jgi:GAF domain-containing protein
MKRPFFRQPATVSAREAASLEALRGKMLSHLLAGAVILGLISFLITLPGRIHERGWGAIVLFSIVLAGLVAVAWLPKFGYRFRAASLVVGILMVGLVTLAVDGLPGSGRVFLLIAPLAGSLFFGTQVGGIAWIVSLLIFVATGLLGFGGMGDEPWLASGIENPNLSAWIKAGVSFAVLGTIMTGSLAYILRNLETGINKEKRLIEDLETERARLEHRVLQRTQDLEHRLAYTRAAAEVIRSVGGYLQSEQLIPKIVQLLQERFNLYFVGMFFLDEQLHVAFLKAGSGEAGEAMLKNGFQLQVNETSPVGWCLQHKQPRIAVDVGFDAVRFNNPFLPMTRSELSVPLTGGKGIFGALTIQSSEVNAFDQEDLTTFQGIADVLATAIENARLFEQLEQSLEEIQTLHRRYIQEAWKEVAREEEIRQFTTGIQRTTSSDEGYSIVVPMKLRDQEIGQLILEMDHPSLTAEEQALVEAVTTQAAVALENVRLLEKNQRQAGYERMLSDISRKARSSTDLETILRVTVEELGQVLGATDGVIRLEIPEEMDEEVQA